VGPLPESSESIEFSKTCGSDRERLSTQCATNRQPPHRHAASLAFSLACAPRAALDFFGSLSLSRPMASRLYAALRSWSILIWHLGHVAASFVAASNAMSVWQAW